MAFQNEAGPSSRPPQYAYFEPQNARQPTNQVNESQFDLFEWYPHFQSCHAYFLDHAQYSGPVQALAAFINITLPCQRYPHPILSSKVVSAQPILSPIADARRQGGAFFDKTPDNSGINRSACASISLIPYIRRLVVTGFDNAAVLHGFFGDAWQEGVGSLHEVERRNYLFAAKSGSWLEVKSSYEPSSEETIPFMKPLQVATEKEILQAEAMWSDWLAMQDWMVGPRAPDAMSVMSGVQSPRIKTEP